MKSSNYKYSKCHRAYSVMVGMTPRHVVSPYAWVVFLTRTKLCVWAQIEHKFERISAGREHVSPSIVWFQTTEHGEKRSCRKLPRVRDVRLSRENAAAAVEEPRRSHACARDTGYNATVRVNLRNHTKDNNMCCNNRLSLR